jgi:hypothetical protein
MRAPAGWEGAERRARPRLLLLGVALLAVIVTALLARSGPQPADRGFLVEPVDEGAVDQIPPAERAPVVADDPTALLPSAGGRWLRLPDAPVVAPGRHDAVWTGEELIVFGDRGAVAAFDPVHHLWWTRASVPGADAPGWRMVQPVWTGAEVLVVGVAVGGTAAHAFDPVAGRWRRLADPPVGVIAPAVSVWAGDSYVLWGPTDGARVREDGPAAGGVYDPGSDSWRRLGIGTVLNVATVDGVATDDGVIVWGRQPGSGGTGGSSSFAARFVPGPDRWEPLPPPPLHGPASAASVYTGSCRSGAAGRAIPTAATGGPGCGEVVLWGRPPIEQGPRGGATGAALDVATGAWRPLPTVAGFGGRAAAIRSVGVEAAWAGSTLLVVGGFPVPALLALEDQAWAALPERDALRAPALAWTGEELLVWGGHSAGGSTVALRSWRPDR